MIGSLAKSKCIVACIADNLNAMILAAHACKDHWGLVELYKRAADLAVEQDAECFFLTYAYVFALQTGHPNQIDLKARLKHYGRE